MTEKDGKPVLAQKMILTSERRAEHLFAGWNTQHIEPQKILICGASSDETATMSSSYSNKIAHHCCETLITLHPVLALNS